MSDVAVGLRAIADGEENRRMRYETMTLKETLAHDFAAIKRVLKKIGLATLRGLFWGCVYLAMAIWFVFNAFVWIAMILTIRDGVQWFLGTNRRR